MAHGEPKDEYNSEQKAAYREAVWFAFAESVPDVATAKVLFFPGRHGFEIPVALRHGFKAENLIACDENAAIIATAKWRKDHPEIRCYGTSLSRTIPRLVQDGIKLDAANLDFCSNLCSGLMADIMLLLTSQPSDAGLVVAVTMLKGREDKTIIDVARLVFQETNGAVDRPRLVQAWLVHSGYFSRTVQRGEYRSGTKNMTFMVLRTKSAQSVAEEWRRFYEAHHDEVRALLEMDPKITEPQPYTDYAALLEEFNSRLHALRIAEWEFRKALPLWEYETGFYVDGEARSDWCALMGLPTRRHREPRYGSDAWRKELAEENAKLRKRLIASEAEKSQILQAGRAYA